MKKKDGLTKGICENERDIPFMKLLLLLVLNVCCDSCDSGSSSSSSSSSSKKSLRSCYMVVSVGVHLKKGCNVASERKKDEKGGGESKSGRSGSQKGEEMGE